MKRKTLSNQKSEQRKFKNIKNKLYVKSNKHKASLFLGKSRNKI